MTLDTSRDCDCPDAPDCLDEPSLDVPILDHLHIDDGEQISVFNDDTDRCYDEWIQIDVEHAIEMPFC